MSDVGPDVYIAAEIVEVENAIAHYLEHFPKDIGEVLKHQGRLLVKDWMRWLPPFATFGGSESFGAQRRIGLKAVEHDIRSSFIDVRTLGIFESPKSPKAGRGAQRVLATRDNDKMQKFLVECGYESRPVVTEPTEAMHNERRDSRGRVHSGQGHKVYVTGRGSVAKFIRLKQGAVGKLKAGLMPAVRALNVAGIPQWIAKHSPRGGFTDGTSEKDPFISITNAVPWAAKSNSEHRTAELALSRRAQALVRQIAAKLEGRIKAFSGK